jgi:hypothetical protein
MRNQRLILDDEDVGGDLLGDFAAGLVHQTGYLRFRYAENVADLRGGKIFNRHQQERLPRQGRDRA